MIDITVANVAGVIAAGFFIASQLSPNALAFILSRILGESNTASTWTVASAALQKSYWPTLLATDQVRNRYSRRAVLWLARLITLMSIILAIGAIVTPLGLYGVLLPGDSRIANFVYIRDTSPFGYGTPPRSNYSWARICGQSGFYNPERPCPWSSSVRIDTTFPNGTVNIDWPFDYSLEVPERLVETYSSGTSNDSTISNYFDIQWRRYSTVQKERYANNSVHLVGSSRNIESVVQDNNVRAVEGLVVDTKVGRVGFRNHTVPEGLTHGAHWQEDLLFVEPETFCLDSNLTLDYTIANENDRTIEGVVLTDRGGFVNLVPHYPEYGSYNDTQKDPALYQRAYKAAWLLSAYSALTLNVTNLKHGSTPSFSYMTSEIGKTYNMSYDGVSSGSVEGLDTLTLSSTFGSWLKPGADLDNPGIESNPWNIGTSNWSSIAMLCSGAGNGDYANITNILIGCGEMRGVPQRVDGGSSLVFEKGSRWSQRIFACATSVKAAVKTVSLSYNTTNPSLESLDVLDIQDKDYADADDLPVWGVENVGERYNVSEINLIWGLVDKRYENDVNVSTISAPQLYLPGWIDPMFTSTGMSYGSDRNMPGSDFSIAALSTAYSVDQSGLGSPNGVISQSGAVDYTGSASLSIWVRWQNLTADAASAAIIPNLIFTDAAASLVVGTKGTLGPGNIGTQNAGIPVQPTISTVRYHLPFAIPALLAAFLLGLIVLGAILSVAIPFDGFGGYHHLKYHIQGLAPGRIYTMLTYPGVIDSKTEAKDWSIRFGDTMISLTHGAPVAQHDVAITPPEKVPLETTHFSQGRYGD